MHQQLLVALVNKAVTEKSVAFTSRADGVQMLVYPLDHGILVGIGLEGERAQRVDAVYLLHKRADDMARFGSWLPARLKDGSWYVVKRVLAFDLNFPALDQSDLEAAEELLS